MNNSPYLDNRPEDREIIEEVHGRPTRRLFAPQIHTGWFGVVCVDRVPGPRLVRLRLRRGELIADLGGLEAIVVSAEGREP